MKKLMRIETFRQPKKFFEINKLRSYIKFHKNRRTKQLYVPKTVSNVREVLTKRQATENKPTKIFSGAKAFVRWHINWNSFFFGSLLLNTSNKKQAGQLNIAIGYF